MNPTRTLLSSMIFILLTIFSARAVAQKGDYHVLNDFDSYTKAELSSMHVDSLINKGKPPEKKKPSDNSTYVNEKKGGKMIYTCYGKAGESLRGFENYNPFYASTSDIFQDCSFKFDYKIIESKKVSYVQVAFSTKDQGYSRIHVRFSTDGNLLWSLEDIVDNSKLKFEKEACKSIKQGEENKVEVMRWSGVWHIIVNSDTVKKIKDVFNYPFFAAGVDYIGPQVIAMDNIEINLFIDKKKNAEVLAKLLAQNGSYFINTITCSKGSISPFTIQLEFSDWFGSFRVKITGLTDAPLTLQVFTRTDGGFDLDVDPYKYYKINGEDYSITNMYVKNEVLNFNLSQVTESSAGTSMLNCKLQGNKTK